jgi:hypothetical protein
MTEATTTLTRADTSNLLTEHSVSIVASLPRQEYREFGAPPWTGDKHVERKSLSRLFLVASIECNAERRSYE